MKKLYLVDVSSLFFRAFYAIPPLKTSKGLPTNALYGFISMSIKLLRENRPDYLVYCFDRKEPSFRHEIYEDYKANRTEMPEDLEPQMPYMKKVADVLGIKSLDKLSYEADDIIGTLARFGEQKGCEVSIVSGDKDFAQLVSNHISIYDTMKNVRYDRAGVLEKWGVAPEQMIDYLAIVGDTSDNVPGVHGVGPKGAQKLLHEYKTLEGVYENIVSIKSESLRNKLLESKKNAFTAKKLVTIVTDVDVPLDLEDFKLQPIDKDQVRKFLEELEFEGLAKKILGESSSGEPKVESPKAEAKPKALKKLDALERVQWSLPDLKKNVQPYDEIWVVNSERGFCLGYDGHAIQVDGTLHEIGQVLFSKHLKFKGFDLKSIWRSFDISKDVAVPPTPAWDTMLAAYVVKAGAIEDFGQIYEKYFGEKLPELAGPEDLLKCELQLEQELKAQLDAANLMHVLNEFELPLIPVLYEMERVGVAIDVELLKQQSVGLQKDIQSLESEIQKAAGESFNVASPKQLGAILFEKMKIPVVKKTKTGYSTDNDVLVKLAPQYPICQNIINYRELAKLKSTYVEALPTLVDAKDHRLHTHFYQAVTQTGRLSSANPNLQNIPIRTERGREIRKAFVARPGHVFLSLDYSQIELRILAEITADPGLCSAFKNDLDIHSATAAEIFDVSVQSVTPEHRRLAKAVNFGIAYGQGVFGLAETLDISRDEAKRIIESYFNKFKKVKDYMLDIVQVAKKQGYVETLFGRRRYIDEFKSSNAALRKFGERAAINAPIQGTASDLMKKAMIEVFAQSGSPLVLQVHDELLFECAESDVEAEAQEMKKIMEGIAQWSVPLKVNVAWGQTWEDAHA